MKTWISLFVILLVASATSQAQQRIGLGESANGKLDIGSQTMEDGRYYDLYRYDSPGNETILLMLMSDDFDAYLMVGRQASLPCLWSKTEAGQRSRFKKMMVMSSA